MTGSGKALIAVTIWGGSFVATKIVVRQIDPVVLVTLRMFGGTVILFGMLKLAGQWRGPVRGPLLRDLAILGFIFAPLHLTLQAVALTMTSAGNTAWLTAMAPVFIAVLAWRFLGEAFGAQKVAGFAVAMAGALVVVVAQAGGANILALPSTTGDLIVFVTAITWAVYSVLSKRIAGQRAPGVLMTYVMGLGGLMTVPLFIAQQGWRAPLALDGAGWLALGFLTVFVSALAQMLWYGALADLGAAQVGVFLFVEPPVTTAVAALLLDEPVRPLTLAGGGAILLGVWLVVRARA